MRMAELNRKTNETDISLNLYLDGGEINIKTGIGFFDHMLTALAKHAGFGLKLTVNGDLEVDSHHTIEDTGIVLGTALMRAAGDKAGMARYGAAFVPMDECLAFAALDFCGRPYLAFNAEFPEQRAGEFDTCMVAEFMRAIAVNAGLTLHIKCEYGANSHHMIEAIFKALARALKQAIAIEGDGVLSTKGTLD